MNKREKTLVILTPGFPENEADTTCLPFQQQFVKALKETNPEMNVIVVSFQYPFRKDRYEWFNATVIPFNGRDKGGIHRFLLRSKLIATLKTIHRNTPISGLLSFWYGECAAVGQIFAKKNGLQHFCWILGQDAKKANKYPGRTRLKAEQLIALSDFLQHEFEKNHSIKPRLVIPAGVNTQLYNPPIVEKNIDILGAGSLINLKQYDIFIEVVAEIKKHIPALKVMLAGKGPEKEKLETVINRCGLRDNITLTGRLSYTEVLHLMQRSKIFLHPSSYEGFSGVCLEALYAGCHVVSFCKAMDEDIDQWHIPSTKDEMIQQTLSLLENSTTIYNEVLFSPIEEVVRKMTTLFFKSE